PGAVAVAGDAPAFVGAVRAAMEDTSAEARARRIAIARQNSGAARLSEMCGLIEGVLESRHREASWEHRLRRLYRGARGRAAAVVIGLVLLYMVVFETGFPWWLAEPLRRND